MEKEGRLFKPVLKLIIKGKAFAMCPDCGKSLSMFELYNENCSFCGEVDFNNVIIKAYEDLKET